ncbi:MAG: recombination mediator RecR [Candidatus Saccharibacteria bacterium]
MRILPPAINELVDALGLLPGVGPRTAERYAYYLLRANPDKATKLAEKIAILHEQIDYCPRTFALIQKGEKLSQLYIDPSRDKTFIAVVAEPFDIVALEKTGGFKGTYHVLGGLVSPIDGIGPEQLHISELVQRIDTDKVNEVILATSASVEGESTALYIQKQIGDRKVKISRLARGLPVGLDLEYADQLTLSRALESRQLME